MIRFPRGGETASPSMTPKLLSHSFSQNGVFCRPYLYRVIIVSDSIIERFNQGCLPDSPATSGELLAASCRSFLVSVILYVDSHCFVR